MLMHMHMHKHTCTRVCTTTLTSNHTSLTCALTNRGREQKVYELAPGGFVELASISHAALTAGGTFLERSLGASHLCGDCPATKIRRILRARGEVFTVSDGYVASHAIGAPWAKEQPWTQTW